MLTDAEELGEVGIDPRLEVRPAELRVAERVEPTLAENATCIAEQVCSVPLYQVQIRHPLDDTLTPALQIATGAEG